MSEPGSDPRLTVDLVGHTDAERQLLELWRGGRMPHAVMIAGRPGIGKATLGYRLARFVLAAETAGGLFGEAPDSLYLSPDNPVFRRVASGGHVDLMVLERPWDEKRNRRRGVIPIEVARKAISFLRLTAGEGGWRVLLVDAADDLNPNAANALLKIMEEPPQHVLLILIANAPGQVLPTIRSRCRRITLSPLSNAETMAVVQARRPDATAADQALAVSLAEGSPGQALDLLEQGAAAVYSDLVDLIASLPDYGFAKALAFAEKVGTSTDDAPFAVFRTLFTGWLSRLLRGAVAGDAAGSTEQEAGMNSRLATAGALDPWFEVWDKARTWFAETEDLNLDRKQAVLAVIEACAAAARRSADRPGPVGARA